MSDLQIYELEDIVWEIGDNDDHIVPHPGAKKIERNSRKKRRFELSCTESNADNKIASDNVNQRKHGTSHNDVKDEKETMLEKNPSSHSSSGGFSVSVDGDSNRKTSCYTSDEERTSNECMRSSNMDSISSGICADDPILGDQTAAVDNNLYPYPLSNANHAENNLDIFANDLDDKECSDLLYYGWPEIENFEDVDRMFRSCDSTFGLEINNNDELGWFSSSHAIEGSDDALEPSFNLPSSDPSGLDSVTERQEVYGLNNSGLVTDESSKKLTPNSRKGCLQNFAPDRPSTVMNSLYPNGSGVVSHIDGESQMHSLVKQSKHQTPSEGKRMECPLENGVSFIDFDNMKEVGESNNLLSFKCNFLSENCRQDTTHQTCAQMSIPLINPNSNQALPSISSSIVKPEDSGLPSTSPRESSYASNQMQTIESSHDVSFQNPTASGNKKKDRLHHRQSVGHREKSNLMARRADSNPVCVEKQIPKFENEVEGHSEVDGCDIGTPAELDASNIQESSCMSSVLDEVSIDASSFRQLQHVMGQLDIRMKLCIRDSLYRLARSAEQRHKCGSRTCSDGDDKDASGASLSDETNKCSGFMDMEADTNPIDRSIAHLLFHRPSTTAAFDAPPGKSYIMVQAPNHSPLMPEKRTCQEETTSANGEATKHRM